MTGHDIPAHGTGHGIPAHGTGHGIPAHGTGHDTGDNVHGQGAHVQDSSGPGAPVGAASLGVLRAEAVRVLTAACRARRPVTGRGCATTAGGPVDFAGFVASVLASVAANVGSTARLTAGRSGSWEADLVDRLVAGTVGQDDAHVFAYRTQAVVVPLNVLDLAWDVDGFPNYEQVLEAAWDAPFTTGADPCRCGGAHTGAGHPRGDVPGDIAAADMDDDRADVMAAAAEQAVQAAVVDAYASVYGEYARRFTDAVHAAAAGVPGLLEALAAAGTRVVVTAVHDPRTGADEALAVRNPVAGRGGDPGARARDVLTARLWQAAVAAVPVPAAPVLPAVADIARPAVTAALTELAAQQAEQTTGQATGQAADGGVPGGEGAVSAQEREQEPAQEQVLGQVLGQVLEGCEVCADEREDCSACEGSGEDPDRSDGECTACWGAGEDVPEHCCDCGGSPYCVRCHACGAACVGSCTCPVTVRLDDGTTKSL